MAYRYRRRRYRRRGGYRPRKTYAISRYNTFRYRSSKAQANQIYRINKKINAIQREQKPEIKTWLESYSFNVGDYCNYCFGSLTKGQNFNFDGRICRMQNINTWFVLYKDFAIVPSDLQFTATCRIVVYQLRNQSPNILTAPNTIFNITTAERESTDQTVRKNAWMRAIYGPLNSGITGAIKILRDFKITLSPVRERAAKKVVLKNKQIGNIERSITESNYPKGSIYWVAITSLNTIEVAAAALKLQANVKMAYIDES